MIAAVLLPFMVPAVITGILWAMDGDPATNLCPPGLCSEAARVELVEKWHLESASNFYFHWLGNAVQGDFGKSIAADTGAHIDELLWESLPNTSLVLFIALIPIILGTLGAAMGWIPRRLESVLQAVGMVPSVIFALFGVSFIVITYGAFGSFEGVPGFLRIVFAGLILGVADGALAATVLGTRSTLESELTQRYVSIAILRGESILDNTLPNVLPALVGQFRSRVLAVLSGTVIVEVVLQVDGLGDLLWRGTLSQDYFLVLAAAWGFSLISALLLLLQAGTEVAVALHVRRSPKVPA